MKSGFLREEHFAYVTWTGDPQKIVQIHMFIKNNQKMARVDFKATFEGIRDFLEGQSVNFGILLTADGTYVFTEKKVKMDALMVKLATGVNYQGVVANAKQDLDLLNTYLAGKTK